MAHLIKNSHISRCVSIFALLVLLLGGCRAEEAAPQQVQGFALDTLITVTAYGKADPAVLQGCLGLCSEYELVFSRTNEDSELYRLNAAGGGTVSEPMREVLETALRYCALSGGRFDITMGGVSALYGFSSQTPPVPTEAELAEAMTHVGYEKLVLEGNELTITDPGTVIDLGAIAKGYIADRMKDYLLANGVEHALLSLGGNIVCVGGKADGAPFRVGVQYPEAGSRETVAVLETADGSVVTSGVYERAFTRDGVTYHHLLSSVTGRPIANGLLSVTIVADRSVDADALSTAVFALGLEEGMALLDSLDGVCGMLLTEDLTQHCSQGFADLLAD